MGFHIDNKTSLNQNFAPCVSLKYAIILIAENLFTLMAIVELIHSTNIFFFS